MTPLENRFLELAGEESYQGAFIARYFWPLIYPDELTPAIQVVLGVFVLILNAVIYTFVLFRARRRRSLP